MKPRVLIEVSGGVAEWTCGDYGKVDLVIWDWDNFKGDDREQMLERYAAMPEWMKGAIPEKELEA